MTTAISIGWLDISGKCRLIFLRCSNWSLTGQFGIMESVTHRLCLSAGSRIYGSARRTNALFNSKFTKFLSKFAYNFRKIWTSFILLAFVYSRVGTQRLSPDYAVAKLKSMIFEIHLVDTKTKMYLMHGWNGNIGEEFLWEVSPRSTGFCDWPWNFQRKTVPARVICTLRTIKLND